MKQIEEMLFALQDKDYAALTARTAPTLDPATIIGVRVPQVRALAKSLKDDPVVELFLAELPHRYYDENMLHGLLVSEIKEFDTCIDATERFLPYVDNWAVCDILSPKVFKKNKEKLLPKIREWAASSHVYTCRFGMEMLMSHYLDEDFQPEYLEIPAAVLSEEYYVNMMIAWFFATALAKQWDSTIPYLVDGRLGDWVHNKTIQKAIESYRITDEQKTYLRTLKRTGKKDSSK